MIRGSRVYAWITGDQAPRRSSLSREPFKCLVCGNLIIRPKFGGSRQIVHAGKGNKKSKCQKVWRYKQEHGLSIEEPKERLGYRAD